MIRKKKGERLMKILIVNDDSIHAPGIELLAKAAMQLGEVTVVAPARQCSAMSQKITIRGALIAKRVGDFPVPVEAWQVEGTPADCVKAAVHSILEEKPDWVFSGVNAGWNAGFDIAHSGTLGAAFEAAMYGIPAAAFSNAHGASLDLVEKYLTDIAKELIAAQPPAGAVWNVNFPGCAEEELKGVLRERFVAPAPLFREWYVPSPQPDGSVRLEIAGQPIRDPQGVPAGSDLEAVLRGYISIGPVRCTVL